MKKTLLLVLSALLSAGVADAKVQTPSVALQRAMEQLQGGCSMAKGKAAATPELTATESSADGTALYYVYDTNGGFIIASADDRAHSVIGYTDGGSYSEALQNPAFLEWMNDCKQTLTWLSKQPESDNATVARAKAAKASTDFQPYVRPLLKNIAWNQDAPYNGACPQNDAGNYALTGCVATAAGQVMRYYNWPEKTTAGVHTNAQWKSSLHGGSQTIDYSDITIDWANFKDTYVHGKYTTGDSIKIANLMAQLGCALDMKYFDSESGSSGTKDANIVYALCTFFGYNKNMENLKRMFYTSDEWDNILKRELNSKRPVIYGGRSASGGHCFIIDGYDSDGLFHLNWGWGGNGNGYFDINILDSEKGSYSFSQSAIVYIAPDKEYNSAGVPRLELANPMKLNEDSTKVGLSISNTSVVPFSGKVTLHMCDTKGNEISRIDSTYKDMAFGTYGTYYWDLNALGAVNQKDTVVLSLTYNYGEGDKYFPRPKNMISWLTYIPDTKTWTPGFQSPDVEYLGMYANRVGYRPRMKVKCSWSSRHQDELNYELQVFAKQNGKNYCIGQAQIRLKPGQDSIYIIALEAQGKDSIDNRPLTYQDLKAGECSFSMTGCYYGFSGPIPQATKYGKFEMVEEEDSVLTYSNCTTDKAEYLPHEPVKASFTIQNTGGYADLTYSLYSAVTGDDTNVMRFYKTGIGIAKNDVQTVTFVVEAPSNPGTYTLDFVTKGPDNKKKHVFADIMQQEAYTYKVVNATGINEVENGESKTENTAVYNLAGQRLTAPLKGINIIGGKKYLK